MAYDVTLAQLVDQVRSEIGASNNPAQGTGQLHIIQQTLRRNQARLYADFNWPHLVSYRDEQLRPGERYYSYNADVNFDRIVAARVLYTNTWQPVEYGIPISLYNAINSENGTTSDPVRNWQHYERGQFEVWPVPSVAQTLRFKATLNLRPLIANEDKADLDSDLLVLFTAAEMLTRAKSADAQVKQQLAASHYKAIRGNQVKTGIFVMGGGYRSQIATKPWPDDWPLRVKGA